MTADDLALFNHLSTVDFEEVLHCLTVAEFVVNQISGSTAPIALRYKSLRQKLVDVVDGHHVSWPDAQTHGVLKAWNAELVNYTSVFSTNYDLLLYWSINQNPKPFVDFFFSTGFEETNCQPFSSQRPVWWLHGGLHLHVVSATGEVQKHVATSTRSIQSLFSSATTRSLFIAEGTPQQKRSRIRSSAYLETAFQHLGLNPSDLVILGSQLGSSDTHLVDAINKSPCSNIQVGIYPIDTHQVTQARGRFGGLFPTKAVEFFDSETHPLTEPILNIP